MSSDLRRPLLEHGLYGSPARSGRGLAGGDEEEQQQQQQLQQEQEKTAMILEEWNASVSAFVAENGGDDNISCYVTEDSFDQTINDSQIDDYDDDDVDDELEENVVEQEQDDPNDEVDDWRTMVASKLGKICTATLLPDTGPIVPNNGQQQEQHQQQQQTQQQPMDSPISGNGVHIKFFKFVALTFGSIALVRRAVLDAGITDRDRSLTIAQIMVYEGDSILRDLAVFFAVGRMHHRTGIDTLEWLAFGLLANLYFESQSFVGWLQHSFTPYEMRCLWPRQLWAFAAVVVFGILGGILAHVVEAHNQHKLRKVFLEVVASIGFFVVPVAASPYAHFHHWFAGWILGMHANHHRKWWSRAAMAYCWGMYVNGIAVYGRDPLLTCDYARFLMEDQNCPAVMLPLPQDETGPSTTAAPWTTSGAQPLLDQLLVLFVLGVSEYPDPPDWRNCSSSSGYHP